jgi:hypothetical protein
MPTHFFHDVTARNDAKIKALFDEYGVAGYGLFWVIVEILCQCENYQLDLENETVIRGVARTAENNKEYVVNYLEFCVKVGLLVREGNFLYSHSLRKRMSKIDGASQRAKLAANKRWSREPIELSENSSQEQSVPFPEVKAPKEKKKENISLEIIKQDALFEEFYNENIAQDQTIKLTKDKIIIERAKFIDYLAARGKVYKNYKAAFKNWLRSQYQNPRQKSEPITKMVY